MELWKSALLRALRYWNDFAEGEVVVVEGGWKVFPEPCWFAQREDTICSAKDEDLDVGSPKGPSTFRFRREARFAD